MFDANDPATHGGALEAGKLRRFRPGKIGFGDAGGNHIARGGNLRVDGSVKD